MDDDEFGTRVAELDKQSTTLRTIIEQALVRIHRELGDVRHWPAKGWDFKTTVSLLEDMLPDATEVELEGWAIDDMEAAEHWLDGR